MQTPLFAMAILLAASIPAVAQTATPPGPGTAAQARPARGPDQTSVPSNAPPATTQQTTGARDQGPAVKQMNEAERQKVETHGK